MPDVTVGGQMQMCQNMFGGQLAAALFSNVALHGGHAAGSAGASTGVHTGASSGGCPLEPPKAKLPPREQPTLGKSATAEPT
eukprot:2718731-Pyramimonas_sp.AAC.1